MDSSTISLFKDILKCVGRRPKEGKRKGGVKIHAVINADEIVPSLVWFSSAATHDQRFLKKLECNDNTIYVFDKGYNDYKAFKHFGEHKTGFVTRIKDNARFDVVEKNDVPDEVHSGILLDEIIEVDVKEGKASSKLKLRKVVFYDRQNKREFELITNLFDLRADFIAAFYKIRWQMRSIHEYLLNQT